MGEAKKTLVAVEEAPAKKVAEPEKHAFEKWDDGRVAGFSYCGKVRYDGRELTPEMPVNVCRECWVIVMRREMA